MDDEERAILMAKRLIQAGLWIPPRRSGETKEYDYQRLMRTSAITVDEV